MLLLQTTVIVGPDRTVTVHLPHNLPVGRHRVTVRLDEAPRGREPEVQDVIGYDYDQAQADAYEAVYHN